MENQAPKPKLKTKLTDLNNHLFETIERLNDENLLDEELAKEIMRSKGIAEISTQILNVYDIELKACKAAFDMGLEIKGEMRMLLEEEKK